MKYSYMIIFLMGFAGFISAQPKDRISDIKIDKIFWQVNDKDTVNIETAEKGINSPREKLSIVVYLENEYFKTSKAEKYSFEIKWYRFGPTKKFLTDSFIKEYVPEKGKQIVINSSRANLQPGWWEVEIMSYSDNGLLQFKKLSKFRLLIR